MATKLTAKSAERGARDLMLKDVQALASRVGHDRVIQLGDGTLIRTVEELRRHLRDVAP